MLVIRNMQLDLAVAQVWTEYNTTLAAGDILHITGENGVGKSTYLRALYGLLPATGAAFFNQSDGRIGDHQWCEEVGLLQRNSLPFQGSVEAVLRVLSRVYAPQSDGDECVQLAVDQLALSEKMLLDYLSAGQLQRVLLSPLVFANKKVWLLDEPFASLDSKWCRFFIEKIREHCVRGGVVIYTGHCDFDVCSMQQAKRLHLERMHVR